MIKLFYFYYTLFSVYYMQLDILHYDKFELNIIASGGVSSMEDVAVLSNMGLFGAIVGKAIYTGAIELSEAILLANFISSQKEEG